MFDTSMTVSIWQEEQWGLFELDLDDNMHDRGMGMGMETETEYARGR